MSDPVMIRDCTDCGSAHWSHADCRDSAAATPRGVAARHLRLYLAGPMTGIPDFNLPAFRVAAARLRACGYDVVNPAETDGEPQESRSWADWMRRDIPLLLGCEAVALLPGWEKSRGASLEAHIARALRMPLICAITLGRIAAGEEDALLLEVLAELRRARTLFPGENVTTLALVEEVGELAKATFSESRERVREEAVQVAAMAMRVVLDGDSTLDGWRARRRLDPLTEATGGSQAAQADEC